MTTGLNIGCKQIYCSILGVRLKKMGGEKCSAVKNWNIT